VRLKLFKGNVTILGRKAPRSLYNPALATFEEDSVYNQADAEGFIRLNALRLKTYHDSFKAADFSRDTCPQNLGGEYAAGGH
jgi:argininosuccinate synthase